MTYVDTSYARTDASHIELQVAGVDAKSGELALYRFFGRAVSGVDDPTRCAAQQRRAEGSARAGPS
jgi:hypothetical protein